MVADSQPRAGPVGEGYGHFLHGRFGVLRGGGDGSVATSADGASWTTAATTGSGHLCCVDFFDALHGVAAGNNTGTGHNVIRTTDGGSSWAGADCGFDVRSACMVTSDMAVLAGTGGRIATHRFGEQTARTRLSAGT